MDVIGFFPSYLYDSFRKGKNCPEHLLSHTVMFRLSIRLSSRNDDLFLRLIVLPISVRGNDMNLGRPRKRQTKLLLFPII